MKIGVLFHCSQQCTNAPFKIGKLRGPFTPHFSSFGTNYLQIGENYVTYRRVVTVELESGNPKCTLKIWEN